MRILNKLFRQEKDRAAPSDATRQQAPSAFDKIRRIAMIAVAVPQDETDERWLGSEALVAAFRQANPGVPARIIRRLWETDNVKAALFARAAGSSLEPNVAFDAGKQMLGALADSCSVIFQCGLTRVASSASHSREIGFCFCIAYTPPQGEKPIAQLVPLNRPIDSDIILKRVPSE